MKWIVLYIGVFLSALGVSAALCGAARALGLRLGIMDVPTARKNHGRPIAVTGGWGFFATFLLFVGGGALLLGPVAAALPPSLGELRHYIENLAGLRKEIAAILGGLTLVFVVGAVDDRRPLGPWVKLGAQILATLPLVAVGVMIRGFLPLPVGAALTIGWVVLLTNSFNLLDNMDGLSASVACVVCVVLALAARQGGELWLPALFLCFAGALGGFLIYNFHPASMFMGDAGSLTIGYLVAVFSILVTYYGKGEPTSLPVLMPVAVMGVPLFDTLSVMFIRWKHHKPLMVGDRNHFSHRLLAMGFTVRETAVTIALLTAASGLLALPLRFLAWPAALVHMLGLVLLFSVIVMLELVGRLRK
jgi:UDP-GlcNAc:undecaprenyl-phosphate GlcNAc-1-phosphate transferase